MPVSKIDFFQPAIWQDGALLKEVERSLARPDDPYASGRWKPVIAPAHFEKIRDTLGGRATESFDPAGYLAEVGLPQSLTAGRTDRDVLRAFHLVNEYRPDSRYFPFSNIAGARIQKIFLAASRLSVSVAAAANRLIDPLAVKMTEKKFKTDHYHSAPYGRFEEIAKGVRSELPKESRYFGILRRKLPQYAWDRGPHTGSIDPGPRAAENFGTYDIALKFGFSDQQARRIAKWCYDVDESKTHYRDPRDPARLRITGTVGRVGDIQRHYNRSPYGEEDSRIVASRVHLDRALQLADQGYYEAAEREFGIGLHSLQDIFSHAQLTPTTHTCLGEFPDLVKYHPLSMFETAVATEGYFKKFITGLGLKPIEQTVDPQSFLRSSDTLVGGSAGPEAKSAVSGKIAEFAPELSAFLENNGIHIFVSAESTTPLKLGFGMDLDGDGLITPGKWVDIHKDGRRYWFEFEDQYNERQTWGQQPAGYNHFNRVIFLSARLLSDPGFEKILKHEINHAVDLTCLEDPQLKDKWDAYINKLYNTARRTGEIAFDELDPHEYFAGIET